MNFEVYFRPELLDERFTFEPDEGVADAVLDAVADVFGWDAVANPHETIKVNAEQIWRMAEVLAGDHDVMMWAVDEFCDGTPDELVECIANEILAYCCRTVIKR